ncbi:MAG: XRE family transcriptional regulator [Bacteroidota bacterium]
MDRMGKRIREKREKLGYQIKDISVKIGVTSSLISQIEKGKAFPSIVTLIKVAEALDTTVGELIGENENSIEHPLVKPGERRFAKKNNNGTSSYLLSNHITGKQIEPYLIKFGKDSDSKKIMTSNFPGQEFCFVMKGAFEVKINGDNYILHKGDSFYFDSNRKHLFKNISEGDAELIWVITPYHN